MYLEEKDQAWLCAWAREHIYLVDAAGFIWQLFLYQLNRCECMCVWLTIKMAAIFFLLHLWLYLLVVNIIILFSIYTTHSTIIINLKQKSNQSEWEWDFAYECTHTEHHIKTDWSLRWRRRERVHGHHI